jgi:Macrocin-O-methyltransferase (TylF)
VPFISEWPFWVKRTPLEAVPNSCNILPGLVNGRSLADGYARGWGLQYGNLRKKVLADPLYIEAMQLARGRTLQEADRRANLFLLLKFYVQSLPTGDVIEFGSFRGGSAIFMAKVCVELGLQSQIWALDTFAGMPSTDKRVDAHTAGDFKDTNLEALKAYTAKCGLTNLHWIQGLFEDTCPGVLAKSTKMILAHIDCDIRSGVQYSYNAVKPHMADGGYIVFDDATVSSCLGATEIVETDVIRRDGLNCEQIYPHFVFRCWDRPGTSNHS